MEHHERRTHNDQMASDIAYIRGKMEGYNDRVEKLEKSQERQWWMSYVITPALIVLHTIARTLGATRI